MSEPATEAPAPAPPRPAAPPPPPAPRQLGAHAAQHEMRPSAGALVNPGDLVARLGDGSACPASAWPRTGNFARDRRAFAAAFRGVSASYHDPARPTPGKPPAGPVRVLAGGPWAYPVRGDVNPGDPVGPAVEGDGLSAAVAQACPPDQAVGKAAQDLGGGVWRVELSP